MKTITRFAVSLAAMAAGAALPAVVSAQSAEEITVTGAYGSTNDRQTLSQAISYSDLDLSTKAGKDELRHRVNLTARYLCEKMGESDTSNPVVPSCREAAVRDAMARVGTVEATFAPRGTTWTAPTAWVPPYPADWGTRYP